MTDENLSFEYRVLDEYRDVVGEFGREGVDRKAAADLVVDRLRSEVTNGTLQLPLDEVLRAAVVRVDEREGRRADRVLRDLCVGQDGLPMADDPALDVIVTLGEGRRKAWRYVQESDLREMDALRYRNMRAAFDAYSEWRDLYEPWLDCVARHGTVGAAVANRDVPGDGQLPNAAA